MEQGYASAYAYAHKTNDRRMLQLLDAGWAAWTDWLDSRGT